MAYNPNKAHLSYKAIHLTRHARQRACERMGINKDAEIQKAAIAARYKGVKVDALHEGNYKYLVSRNMYRYLKNHYGHYYNNDRTYYYKDWCFVFAGKSGLTLKTIVPCTIHDMKLAISKMDKCKPEEVED